MERTPIDGVVLSPRAPTAVQSLPFAPSSSVTGVEVIVATGDFVFQFCFWGWLWGAHAFYMDAPGVQTYSSFDIYLPVVIGLLIGWLCPYRRIHDCLCVNLRCTPFSAEFTSCCLGCVFLLCTFLLLATQRANELSSAAFVFSTGVLAGLGGSNYFAASNYLIVNLAFIRSRPKVSGRMRSYLMVSAAARGSGILVLGSMISSESGKVNDTYDVALFLAGLMLINLAVVIVAGTRKTHLSISDSASFRSITLRSILEAGACDENVA